MQHMMLDPLYNCMYLARSTMRTKLAKAQWRLDASQQCHHIQMFNSPPVT